ncbi:MAG: hypothetical protein HRU75_01460 [Planctomycetia bacterium]|nr:MAG: hypothetical protein HRU75_01460 [Planctomycetia bacterium]
MFRSNGSRCAHPVDAFPAAGRPAIAKSGRNRRGPVLRAVAHPFTRGAVSAAALLALIALPACEREPTGGGTGMTAHGDRPVIPPPATRPVYEFAPGLRSAHPEVCDFVTEFLNTCLAGDYNGYRRMVTRRREPETRQRFQAIYYAIRSVRIDDVATQSVRDLAEEAFLVTATVDFDPAARVAVRGSERRIALLIFREDGGWRMAPAPASLQPAREDELHPASAPTTAPSYPWDVGVDY